jgi:DNA mismatch endonuclease (patch repair protein)
VDRVSRLVRSNIMKRVSRKNTSIELVVQNALQDCGETIRLHADDLPGTPDIVFDRLRIAVQVRGCFWHQHDCQKGRGPASNKSYWNPKLSKNASRDRRKDRALRRKGWSVFVVWQCQIKSPETLAAKMRRLKNSVSKKRSRMKE